MSTNAKLSAPKWIWTLAVVLTTTVCAWALYVWQPGGTVTITAYLLFPLFGLLAFVLMWSHYVVGAVLRLYKQPVQIDKYFRYTSYVVLACILLHPGLLVYQLWVDWGTLPPNSYVQYVGEASKMAVIFGSVGLVCFLLYETKYWLNKSRIWPYIVALSDVAMILIFIHGLRLGSSLRSGWYQYVWGFFGVVLVACIALRFVLSSDKQPDHPTDQAMAE